MTRLAMIAATVAATAMLAGCGGGGGSDNGHAGGQPEPTPSEPPTISLGSTITGTIDSATDVDSFKLPIAQEGTLTIATSGNANPNIRVLDASGTEIPGRRGSWVVDITKDALAKGKHVVVEFFGGTVGESYFGDFMFNTGLPPEMETSENFEHAPPSPWNIFYRNRNPDTGFRTNVASNHQSVGITANIIRISPSFEGAVTDVELERYDALNATSHDVPISWDNHTFTSQTTDLSDLSGNTGITGTGASQETVFATWGNWHASHTSVEAVVIDSNFHDPTIVRPQSFHATGYSRGFATGSRPSASANYTGQAYYWTSKKPDEGIRTRANLIYNLNNQRLDVQINNALPGNKHLKYTVQARSDGKFIQDNDSGRIAASFFGPNHEEVGGVFDYFDGIRNPYADTPGLAGIGFEEADLAIVGSFSAARR